MLTITDLLKYNNLLKKFKVSFFNGKHFFLLKEWQTLQALLYKDYFTWLHYYFGNYFLILYIYNNIIIELTLFILFYFIGLEFSLTTTIQAKERPKTNARRTQKELESNSKRLYYYPKANKDIGCMLVASCHSRLITNLFLLLKLSTSNLFLSSCRTGTSFFIPI